MSDQNMARIARDLAKSLSQYARERSDDSKKQVAALHTSLCEAYRDELREEEKSQCQD